MYTKQCRSILEYAVPAWQGSITLQEKQDIERVQKVALRIIFGDQYETYSNALKLAKLDTLETRKTNICIKFAMVAEKHSKPFITTTGVKQGCVLSPILFNIFIDKISNVFDETCAPVKINNLSLNCLLWANDLLIISQTSEGLQNSLNKMKNYYDSLGLEVNIKKNKNNDF